MVCVEYEWRELRFLFAIELNYERIRTIYVLCFLINRRQLKLYAPDRQSSDLMVFSD
ncbi:hypothetical protein EV198_0053 [Roseivirga ehrenbergii]|nr:hypothetical protein EV198_0053 [Roseivirga ehrenbergii]